MRIVVSGILLIFTLLLGGCWDMIDINSAAIISGIGIDYHKNRVIFTTQFARQVSPLTVGSAIPQTETFTSSGQTITEAARSITLREPAYPLWAHTNTIIISENLAREDLGLLGDFLLRNRNLRRESYIVLAYQDTPEKLLEVPVPLSAYSSNGIKELLDINESRDGAYVPVTLLEFLSRLTTAGIQPVLPQISLAGNQKLHLNGTAVFRDRQLVGSLNEEESRGYRWLHYKTNKGGMLTVNSPLDNKAVSLDINRISSKIRPVLKDDKLIFNIEVNTTLNLFVQSGVGELMTDHGSRQLERLANQEIKRQINACISKSQSLNSDILGFGLQTYRYHPEYWQQAQKDWPAIFPGVQTNIVVNSVLVEGYLIDKSVKLKS